MFNSTLNTAAVPAPQQTMRNNYNMGPRGLVESLIQQQHPTLQTVSKFYGNTAPAIAPAAPAAGGWGFKPPAPVAGGFAAPTNTGFGTNTPFGAKPAFGAPANTFGSVAPQPPVSGIQTEEQLRTVQESINLAQNLRAGVLQLSNGIQNESVSREEYFRESLTTAAPQASSLTDLQRQFNQLVVPMQQQQQQRVANTTQTNSNLTTSVYSNNQLSSKFACQSNNFKSNFFTAQTHYDTADSQQQHLQYTSMNSVAQINPNAPVLQNNDYFTQPSIQQLQTYNDYELSSVQNFKISRVRDNQVIGSILFKASVNLTRVNLDQIVQIDNAMCNVVLCTPESFQLNVPAVIMLYGVFPPDGQAPENYVERIRLATRQVGGRLVKYDVQSGEWVFEVDGFL